MRSALTLPACLLTFMLAGVAPALAVPAGSDQAGAAVALPKVPGVWSWTDTAGCSETYTYAADGSGHVTSGEERSEMRYTFDPTPVGIGFFKLEATITKDHGGKDCAGSSEDDTSRLYTVYMKFSLDGDEHIVCLTPEIKQCFGPLQRQVTAPR
jgi:hypothetical protein